LSSNIKLKNAFKLSPEEHDKILSPEETVRRFKQKVAKSGLNILKETKRVDNGRLKIPVYFSICGEDARSAIGTKKQMGKGTTSILAQASAVMELAERYSLFTFKDNQNNFIIDSYQNLKKNNLFSDKIIPFRLIMQSVHDRSHDISGELEILEKFFSKLSLKWTWGYNVTTKKDVLIPFDWFYAINEFNGSSAGNNSEEAIVQGLSELMERHVSSIVSRNCKDVPQIDIDSIKDKSSLAMIANYKKNGIKIYISDFSLDTGIPTVGVLAYDPLTFPESSEIVWTAGTSPDPEKALSRAVTEVAQLAGDFNTGANYVASGLPKFTKIEEADFIINTKKTISLKDLPDQSDNNIKLEIENCTAALAKNKMELLIVSTKHPKLDIPTFYSIIPGAYFRERAINSNTGMFIAKHITENFKPEKAVEILIDMNSKLTNRYYISFYIGLSYLSLQKPQKALIYFEKAITLNPANQDIPSIYSYMGNCLKDMEQYDNALVVLKKGIILDKDREDIYNLMGFCYFKLKKHEKAIECFQNVLSLNPGSGIEYANIASNYRDMGNYDKAVSYYKIALEFDPTLTFARENLENIT